MAKGKEKGRRSSAADPATATATAPVANGPVPDGDSVPNFSDSALASLTKRIEQKLHGKDDVKPASEKPTKSGSAKSAKEKKDRRSPSEKKSEKKTGKKRDRNGDIIASEGRPKHKESVGRSEPASKNALEEEIYAIGGSKEDYDLLAGVESDSEMEGSAKAGGKSDDDTLRKDIARMLGGASVPDDASDEPSNNKPSKTEAKPAASKAPEAPKVAAKPAASKPAKETKIVQKEDPKPSTKATPTSNLVISPRPDWYSTALPAISFDSNPTRKLPGHIFDQIREHGMSLLEAENKAFAAAQQSSSQKFYSTIMTSGTLSDKISAFTLAVQESPVHNTKALESLVGLAKKRSRAQAVEVLRSIKDLFAQGTLLPGDRRLKSMANQPALIATFTKSGLKWSKGDPLPGGLQPSHLILWTFEDFLKEQYFEVLKVLEVWCNDEIEFSRSRAVSYVFELLKEKPEQEANLLRLLVNKLGDPNKKIASRASYLLLQLEQSHPLMKPTIISAVESDILFRPGQTQHAKYYAIITLNQTVLSTSEEKVAIKLLDIYFGLFVALLKNTKPPQSKHHHSKPKGKKHSKHDEASKAAENHDEQLREKLISGILVGVNRAYPFTQSDMDRLSKHIDTLFRITHSSNFNTSIQALVLIQQLTSSHQVSADRFYRTLYESLLDPRITTSSKQSMYLNLLYKSLKSDLNVKRVKAFVKRLVQILSLNQPSFICGVFYLIRELEKTFPSLTSLMTDPEADDDDDEEVFKDVVEEGEQPAEPAVQESSAKTQQPSKAYDSRKRDPEHSNADRTCLWEILPYLSHFHPSVSVNAAHLVHNKPMAGKADLTIHTLTHFLDRFVYRNPKESPGLRGSSIMQPLAGGDSSGLLVTSGRSTKGQEPVNSEAFWKRRGDEVAAEDAFFHDYFNRLGNDKARKQKTKQKKKIATDEEGEEDSEAEAEIWQALVESRPELEGEQGSDDDLDMEDLESAMAEDEDDDGFAEEMAGDDEGVIFNDESEDEDMEYFQEEQEEDAKGASEAGGDDEDAFDIDASDDDAFVGSDEDLPSDFGGFDDEPVEETTNKGKSSQRQKKRKLKHLPTFASVDDYAALLDKEDDGV